MATGIRISNDKRLVLVSGRAFPELAEEVAKDLGISLLPTIAYDFANSEIYVRYEESLRGSDVFILQSFTDPINKWLMEALLLVDAAKRASAKRITAVMPYYPYARQDKKHKGREPISARLVADMFKTAGADRIMSVDLHAAQSQGFFDGPVDHLWAMPTLVKYVRTRIDPENSVMVSPDAGRIKVAEQWAARLGGVPLAFVHKTRDISRANVAVANRVVGDVAGKTAIIVDDMIDTAGTLVGAINVVKEAGAKEVIVAATHGLLSGPAVERLQAAGCREIIITNTLPVPEEKRFEGLTVLSIAPVLARAIDEVFEDGSVTSLFDGAY
ncbi:ribose-phosphate pyrophosphokinase [Actinobaculum suis]|uniref:Ribose-phosphate pyrophosphokinase n=1 Tax=Actinobaculum suis TaxID=1657 RepID=A0A1B9BAL2_9ACTO|nr:ribose-phosphate diphosphokinase [Actinobaculum suis]OCA93108.1 ribose-phosphate pyrophosphokinase [Actinobaculum suis]OCA93250.1 ribose-phosphate pyrophosphokinase [Actinobaculum suis]VDG75840.1 ribose-phosphate pyrophosphokinase [Actinobaculum suis]